MGYSGRSKDKRKKARDKETKKELKEERDGNE